MLEEGSYQLVFGFQENVDHQVQKLIFNLEYFKDFWHAYPDVNSCRGQKLVFISPTFGLSFWPFVLLKH